MSHIIVIGAGHAGCEAALASARMGIPTTLFTMSLDAVANLPCNPSIGGTGKGHLVYEIDALGGEMPFAADAATIQSRMLNTGKGAAVRSKRVQADRTRYRDHMKSVLEATENLFLVQAEVTAILTEALPTGAGSSAASPPAPAAISTPMRSSSPPAPTSQAIPTSAEWSAPPAPTALSRRISFPNL